jgi:hypothetical protein
MVDLTAVHWLLVEMHGGMLTLATVCILATVAARIHLRMRKTSEKYGVFWPIDSSMGKLARYTEPTAYVAGIVGVIGLIASAIVGFGIWPIGIVTTSPLALSKIMFSVFALELWIIFVLVRSKYGENLWKNGGMATVYSLLGIFGFLLMVLAGSLGAHMVIGSKGSILDPIYALLGINPLTFGVTGLTFVIVLVSITIVEIAVPTAIVLYLQRRARLKDSSKASTGIPST